MTWPLSALPVLFSRIHLSPVYSPYVGPILRSFGVFFIVAQTRCKKTVELVVIRDAMTSRNITCMLISIVHITSAPVGDYKISIWWRYQKEYFPRHWPFVRGIHRSPVNTTHKASNADFLCFFDVGPHNLLNKQLGDRWFDTTWRSYDVIVMRKYCIMVADGP